MAVSSNYRSRNRDYRLLAAEAGPVTDLIATTSGKTLVLLKIVVNVTTYSAQTLTFRDDAGTPVPMGVLSIPASAPTAAGLNSYVLYFGTNGYPLTANTNLDLALSGAGVAANISIEAYEK